MKEIVWDKKYQGKWTCYEGYVNGRRQYEITVEEGRATLYASNTFLGKFYTEALAFEAAQEHASKPI